MKNYLNEVVLLGVVLHESGVVLPPSEFYEGRYPTAQTYDVSDVKELLTHTHENFEGYVVRFESGFTMKVKLDEYVRLHKLMTNFSNVDIWECLMNGDDLESMLKDVPDEIYDWVRKVINELNCNYFEIKCSAEWIYNYVKNEFTTRKEQANWILSTDEYFRKIAPVVFKMLDGASYENIIWKLIRPTYQKPFYQRKEGEIDA